MQGRTVLITGATSGIGLVSARELARRGARVVLLGRSAEKLKSCAAEIAGSETVQCDLASLADVRRAAAEVRQRFDKLHVLMNNAGAVHPKRELTREGHEMTFGVNHLAHFVLTNELLPLLQASAPARIVIVASEAARWGAIDFDDLENAKCSMGVAYGRSKRMNIAHAAELARRLAGTGVTANSLHPGAIASNFGMNLGRMSFVLKLARPFLLSSEQGAQTQIWAAADPSLEGVTGKYFIKKKERTPVAQARDPEVQRRLWAESEKLAA